MDWKWWIRDPTVDAWEDFFSDRKTAVATAQELSRIFKMEAVFNEDRITGGKPKGCRISALDLCIPTFHTNLLDGIAKAERRRTGNPRQPANAQQFIGGVVLPLFFYTQHKRIQKLIEDYSNGKP